MTELQEQAQHVIRTVFMEMYPDIACNNDTTLFIRALRSRLRLEAKRPDFPDVKISYDPTIFSNVKSFALTSIDVVATLALQKQFPVDIGTLMKSYLTHETSILQIQKYSRYVHKSTRVPFRSVSGMGFTTFYPVDGDKYDVEIFLTDAFNMRATASYIICTWNLWQIRGSFVPYNVRNIRVFVKLDSTNTKLLKKNTFILATHGMLRSDL